MARELHLALYGNVSIRRVYCRRCESYALVLDGRTACCDEVVSDNPETWLRVSEPEYQRRVPGVNERATILDRQGNRCLYCDRDFGSFVRIGTRLKRVAIHWDHLVPFSYSGNSEASNFVAACTWCNHWKGNMVFQTIDEARVYLAEQWRRHIAKWER